MGLMAATAMIIPLYRQNSGDTVMSSDSDETLSLSDMVYEFLEECDSSPERSNLSHNRLSGPLPNGLLSSLTELRVLDLSFNHLIGKSPLLSVANSNNTSTSSLVTVDLPSNRFRGEIPVSFFEKAWNLTGFNVSNNSFSGAVPSSVCSGQSLGLVTVLDFSYNQFSGELPAGLGECTRLQNLRFGFNNLSGAIPDDIYTITALKHLSFAANSLTGEISNSISGLTNLRILELYGNQFTGSIPPDIGKLTNLEQLGLYNNNFTGSLPQSLTNCSKLTTLNLRVNDLSGKITEFDFSAFPSLVTLDLGNNNFSGTLPASLYSCKNLTAVRFASNMIVGEVSPEIVQLQSLSFLSLSNNMLVNFNGAMKILMGCKSLGTVILSKNFFGEPIPDARREKLAVKLAGDGGRRGVVQAMELCERDERDR